MTATASESLLTELPDAWRPQVGTLLGWAAVDWLLIATGWWMLHAFDNGFVAVAATLLIAGRLHALGVILHDACHRPSRKNTPAWWLLEALAGWPIASTTAAMRYHHLRHHRFSGTAQDPYKQPLRGTGTLTLILLSLRGLLLPPWWALRAVMAPIALVWPAARNVYGRAFLQDRSGHDLRDNSELLGCARADLVQLAAHVAVIFVVTGFELQFVSYYLVPLLIAGVLNAHRVAVEHTADEISAISRSTVIATTRTNNAGWFGNWLLYPHNMGMHLAHHLHPGVSFVHLPKLQSTLTSAGH